MGHENVVISGHHYLPLTESEFCPGYVAGNIGFTFPWKEGQIPNKRFKPPETSQVSSWEQENNLFRIVTNAGSSEQNIDTGSHLLNSFQNSSVLRFH